MKEKKQLIGNTVYFIYLEETTITEKLHLLLSTNNINGCHTTPADKNNLAIK